MVYNVGYDYQNTNTHTIMDPSVDMYILEQAEILQSMVRYCIPAISGVPS